MIPKIIHQSWKTDVIPDEWKEYQETWKKHFPAPEYKYILWTDEDNRNLIKDHYPWFLKTYDNYPKNIQRADAVRYFYLYHYGGIYADLDCEVRTNFYQYLDGDNINIVQSCYHDNRIMNCLMASPKGIDGWNKIFLKLKECSNILSTLSSTGPQMISEVFTKDDITVLSYNEFNPLRRRGMIYGFFENAFSVPLDDKKSKNWDKAYVVHHGTESWREEEVSTYFNHNLNFIIAFILLLIFFLWIIFKRR